MVDAAGSTYHEHHAVELGLGHCYGSDGIGHHSTRPAPARLHLRLGDVRVPTAVSHVDALGMCRGGDDVECSPHPVGAAAGMGKKAGTKSHKPNICSANTAASRQEACIAVPMLALPHCLAGGGGVTDSS